MKELLKNIFELLPLDWVLDNFGPLGSAIFIAILGAIFLICILFIFISFYFMLRIALDSIHQKCRKNAKKKADRKRQREYQELCDKIRKDPYYQEFLEKYPKDTVLLNPKRVSSPLPRTVSKIGGDPYMDMFPEWPECVICKKPLLYLLQVFQKDVLEIQFPTGKDVFYLFACYAPDCQKNDDHVGFEIIFKSTKDKASEQLPVPSYSFMQDDYPSLPLIECSFTPEKEIDYPLELDKEMCDLLRQSEDEDVFDYISEVTPTKDNTKLSGYCNTIQGEPRHDCKKCKKEMEFFFELTSSEGFQREGTRVHNIFIGDGGNIYVFMCRHCPDSPTFLTFDCF